MAERRDEQGWAWLQPPLPVCDYLPTVDPLIQRIFRLSPKDRRDEKIAISDIGLSSRVVFGLIRVLQSTHCMKVHDVRKSARTRRPPGYRGLSSFSAL